MAIGTPVTLGSTHTQSSWNTLNHTTTALVPTGSRCFIGVGYAEDTVGGGVPTIAGSSLTWVKDKEQNVTVNASDEMILQLWSADCPAGLASGETWTASIGPPNATWGATMIAAYATGLATGASGYTDGDSANFTDAAGFIWDAGPITTTTADTLIMAMAQGDGSGNGGTHTAGGGFTDIDTHDDTGNDWLHVLQYKILSSPGTHTPQGTFSAQASFQAGGVGVAYKADGPPPSPSTAGLSAFSGDQWPRMWF